MNSTLVLWPLDAAGASAGSAGHISGSRVLSLAIGCSQSISCAGSGSGSGTGAGRLATEARRLRRSLSRASDFAISRFRIRVMLDGDMDDLVPDRRNLI